MFQDVVKAYVSNLDVISFDDRFDPFEWEREYLPCGSGGMVRVLTAFRRELERISSSDYTRVVWKNNSAAIQKQLKLSSAGYWGPLKKAEKLGFIMRIIMLECLGVVNLSFVKCRMSPNSMRWQER